MFYNKPDCVVICSNNATANLETKFQKQFLNLAKIMKKRLNIALVAHDNMKKELVEWVDWNHRTLLLHHLTCTGTTGRLVSEALNAHHPEVDTETFITLLKSGPLGGDQQLGALIATSRIDILIFFWDPMSAQPHDVDVKALLRLASVYNVPTAINKSSADYIISSPLLGNASYSPAVKNFSEYIERRIY